MLTLLPSFTQIKNTENNLVRDPFPKANSHRIFQFAFLTPRLVYSHILIKKNGGYFSVKSSAIEPIY